MTQSMRTTITLVALGVLLMIAAVWGWNATMKPLPAKVDSPVCVDSPVSAGEKVYPQQVTVSVYNSGTREGLAGRTMQLLRDAGFSRGQAGNAASAKVDDVEIWTTTPDSPDVQLLATYLGDDVDIERREGPGVGVTIVVGDRFRNLAEGQRSIVAEADAEICSPPVA
jgi:hypothetical protein